MRKLYFTDKMGGRQGGTAEKGNGLQRQILLLVSRMLMKPLSQPNASYGAASWGDIYCLFRTVLVFDVIGTVIWGLRRPDGSD